MVVITGGEPLLQQRELKPLVDALRVERGWRVEVETAGTIAPDLDVDQWNVSPKLANSGNPRDRRYKPDVLRAFEATGRAAFKFVVARSHATSTRSRRSSPSAALDQRVAHAGGHRRRDVDARLSWLRPPPSSGAGTSPPGCTSSSGATSAAGDRGAGVCWSTGRWTAASSFAKLLPHLHDLDVVTLRPPRLTGVHGARRRPLSRTTSRTSSAMLDGRRAVIVGHSLGGDLALAVATRRPDDVVRASGHGRRRWPGCRGGQRNRRGRGRSPRGWSPAEAAEVFMRGVVSDDTLGARCPNRPSRRAATRALRHAHRRRRHPGRGTVRPDRGARARSSPAGAATSKPYHRRSAEWLVEHIAGAELFEIRRCAATAPTPATRWNSPAFVRRTVERSRVVAGLAPLLVAPCAIVCRSCPEPGSSRSWHSAALSSCLCSSSSRTWSTTAAAAIRWPATSRWSAPRSTGSRARRSTPRWPRSPTELEKAPITVKAPKGGFRPRRPRSSCASTARQRPGPRSSVGRTRQRRVPGLALVPGVRAAIAKAPLRSERQRRRGVRGGRRQGQGSAQGGGRTHAQAREGRVRRGRRQERHRHRPGRRSRGAPRRQPATAARSTSASTAATSAPAHARPGAAPGARRQHAVDPDACRSSAGTAKADIPTATLQSWIQPAMSDAGPHLTVDPKKTLADLAQAACPTRASRRSRPGSPCQRGQVLIIDGSNGTGCCDDDAVDLLNDALRQAARRTLRLPLKVVEPRLTPEAARKLGIIEKVATFTTSHPAGQPRVKNIHLIADMVRGSLIRPGNSFSINGTVGQRTAAKGFVPAPVIEDQVFAESVGGGISQFATTLFNAAFFAGLEFKTYQAHTLYISRYPVRPRGHDGLARPRPRDPQRLAVRHADLAQLHRHRRSPSTCTRPSGSRRRRAGRPRRRASSARGSRPTAPASSSATAHTSVDSVYALLPPEGRRELRRQHQSEAEYDDDEQPTTTTRRSPGATTTAPAGTDHDGATTDRRDEGRHHRLARLDRHRARRPARRTKSRRRAPGAADPPPAATSWHGTPRRERSTARRSRASTPSSISPGRAWPTSGGRRSRSSGSSTAASPAPTTLVAGPGRAGRQAVGARERLGDRVLRRARRRVAHRDSRPAATASSPSVVPRLGSGHRTGGRRRHPRRLHADRHRAQPRRAAR